MRIYSISVLLVAVCGVTWAQSDRPGVDWVTISQKLDALRAAVEAQDIEKTSKATEDLSSITSKERLKQMPTDAEFLQKMEERIASSPRSRSVFLPHMGVLAFRAGELKKAEQYAHETLEYPP